MDQAYLNVTLQAFGGLISLMIIVFVKYVRREQSKSDRLYNRFLICNTMLLFSNVLSWSFDGKAGESYRAMILTVNLLMYLLHYLLLGTVTDYLLAYLEEWGIRCGRFARVIWGIVAVGCLLVILSQFNDMYYFIDNNNVYQRGDCFLLFPMIGIVGVVIDFALLISQCRKLRSKEFRTFLVLLILAILALSIQALFYGAVYLYITTTFVAISIYIFIQAEQSRKLSEQALELERGKTAIMLSQIQPHFLYNSLQSIKLLCDIDPPRASEALGCFSYYLRGNLDALLNTKLVSFEHELVHIQNYLYLEKMRFGKKLNIEWELNDKDFVLPTLSVQPIIENAIRHGINKRRGGGTLTIRTERIANDVIVTIRDNGVGFSPTVRKEDGHSHIGLENTRKRLEILCGGSLVIESEIGVGTTVKMILHPKEAVK